MNSIDPTHDEDGFATFAFQDLDYIPYGVGGTLAPYIETPAATMRAAATLMRLDYVPDALATQNGSLKTIVCDLGCGDGEFLIGLLGHLNANPSRPAAQGVGIDYNAALIQTAIINSDLAGVSAEWLIYDFNEDQDDLVKQLVSINHVTHLFIYLLPKQLALRNVRAILTRLYDSGVVVCCHKYHPDYLTGVRFNKLMELIVYERVIAPGMG